MLDADARAAVLSSLPPEDLPATFIWVFPDAEVSAERSPLWRFDLAARQANKSDTAAARKGFQSLLVELQANGQPGRLLDETQRSLAQSGSTAPAKKEVAKRPGR